MVFSLRGLLAPVTVAEAALGLLDGGRIVRTVPAVRGGLLRFAGVNPLLSLPVLAQMRKTANRRRTLPLLS